MPRAADLSAAMSAEQPAQPPALRFWCLLETIVSMETMVGHDLLTTEQAATLLRVSRQHVVNLCERGVLPYCRVGTHRRLRRADIEVLISPMLTRDQERALWLHHLVAARLVGRPTETIAKARDNLQLMRQTHGSAMASRWLDKWEGLFDTGIDRVLETLVSRAPEAMELRQNSPFAGVLTTEERLAALAQFRAHWRKEHAA